MPVALPVGHSVEGRPIRASGSGSTLLLVGCVHGNECAGMAIVRRFVGVHGVVVLPTLNPDGLAAGVRGNARGVDLNRDFPDGRARETRIAMRLIERTRPAFTLWFHQHQRIVRAWGPSVPAARRYARLVGLPFRRLPWPRGSATRWQNRTFAGTSSFVVELPAGRVRDPARYARAALRLAQ